MKSRKLGEMRPQPASGHMKGDACVLRVAELRRRLSGLREPLGAPRPIRTREHLQWGTEPVLGIQ